MSMSLRGFHVVFVVLALALSVLTGIWSLNQFRLAGGATWLTLGIVCLAVAVGLVVYGLWFVRKTKGKEYQ